MELGRCHAGQRQGRFVCTPTCGMWYCVKAKILSGLSLSTEGRLSTVTVAVGGAGASLMPTQHLRHLAPCFSCCPQSQSGGCMCETDSTGASSFPSEHAYSFLSWPVQASGWAALPLRHRSYCSICGLHLSFTLVMAELRAWQRSGAVSGRVGAVREACSGGSALFGRTFAQGTLALVALALPPTRIGVDAVSVRGELR